MKILYIDLETTGLDEHKNGIYQISGLIEIDGKLVDEFNIFCDVSNYTISDYSIKQAKSHNIDILNTKHLMTPRVMLDRLLEVFDTHINKYDKSDKYYICGYNIRFDELFLRALFLQFDNRYYDSYVWSTKLDVMDLAGFVLKGIRNKITSFELSNICKLFNIPIQSHDASEDILATYHLYQTLQKYIIIKELK